MARDDAITTPKTREEIAIQSQLKRPNDLVIRILSFCFGSFKALVQVYKRVSPAMPDDLKNTPMPDALPTDPSSQVELYNYDEGHAGRYTVPTVYEQGGSLIASHAKPEDPAALTDYIGKNLRFPPPLPSFADDDGKPVVIFSPGLNTIHQPYEDEQTSPVRLAHYVRVLLCVPMCQVHTGTSFDQGDIDVDVTNAWLTKFVFWLVGRFVKNDSLPTFSDDGNHLIFDARTIDTIQTGLSLLNIVDTPLKKSFRAILDSTKQNNAVPITFAVYSRASIEMQSALQKHIEESEKSRESGKDIFARLRKYVTILTIGDAANDFPDGPAYVHLSAWTDQLASSLGVNERRPKGAGKDAVFLNFDSPFYEKAGDNHNFGSVTCQYLSMVLATNKVVTLHELWQMGQDKTLVKPQNVDVSLPAVISLTQGLKWLWNAEDAMKDVPADRFPDEDEAFKTVSINLGTEYAERLRDTFSDL